MTRKDFELIAETLKNLDECLDELSLEVTVEAFALALLKTNPRFDRARFRSACGVN
jgi:hypothetical protein